MSPTLNTSLNNTTNSVTNTSGTGGVNRRTAVLFTRKAKARQSRSGQAHHRANFEGEQKKESDSFRVYR